MGGGCRNHRAGRRVLAAALYASPLSFFVAATFPSSHTGLSLAPGMDECHVLAAFEERACLAFDTPIEDGFTCKRSRESSLASGVLRASLKPRSCSAVEQEALHREFCALFEGFTGEFLDSRGVSEEAFGVALTAAMAERCDNTRSLLTVLPGRVSASLVGAGRGRSLRATARAAAWRRL